MSATLTWYASGLGTKTGTGIANLLDDLDTLVTSKSADANFKWETAGKSTGATPYYYLMRRKDGSAGRIALICWTSAPAANNVAILDGAPTNNNVNLVYFPSGTGTTLSNLTAASGTICGVDTNAVKCTNMGVFGTIYGTSIQPFYYENAEGVLFGFGNPASSSTYGGGAGSLLVDAADVAYDCTFGINAVTFTGFGGTTALFPYQSAGVLAGASTACVRTNYGSSNRAYYQAWAPSGNWANVSVSATDILTDTGNSKAWILGCPLLGNTKGEGMVLKLRQIGYGPGTTGPFSVYNTTGPVVAARQFSQTTTGVTGAPWCANFKI